MLMHSSDARAGRPARTIRSLTAADGFTRGPGRWIPKPEIPVQPVLSWQTFLSRHAPDVPCALDMGARAYVTAGRVAIALALKLVGIGPDSEVLVPAFHCASMVDPVRTLGARAVFYRLHDDLQADLDDLAAKCTDRTQAVLVTNYFGFPQPWEKVRAFADANRLVVVEDCAHSVFGTYRGRPLGTFGDFAVVSLPKFFPVWDGGCLISTRYTTAIRDLPLRHQPLLSQAKAMLHPVEEAADVGRLHGTRLPLAALQRTKLAIRELRTRLGGEPPPPPPVNPAHERSGAQGELDSRWLEIGATWATRAFVRLAAGPRIVARRRANFERLQRGFADVPGCRPLFSALPDGVVPYMFPLWIDDLCKVFRHLEDRAVPMHRFAQFLLPEVTAEVCPTSVAMSRHLLQLPCHQELTAEEADWIVDAVRAVIAAEGRR